MNIVLYYFFGCVLGIGLGFVWVIVEYWVKVGFFWLCEVFLDVFCFLKKIFE